jgi:hypothetical protein
MAAGDQLRVIYSQLSQDPHSLANLDQDLPNYAQRMVPIFTLPQVMAPAAARQVIASFLNNLDHATAYLGPT